jgi:hypothetical protein
MKIISFKELLNELSWSWQFPTYDLERDEDGNFYINKLYINPEKVTYKTDSYELAPGVFKDLERFYDFLKTTDK